MNITVSAGQITWLGRHAMSCM